MKSLQCSLSFVVAMMLVASQGFAGDGPKSPLGGNVTKAGFYITYDPKSGSVEVGWKGDVATPSGPSGKPQPPNENSSGPSGAYNKNDTRKDGKNGNGFGSGSSNSKQL